MDIKDHDTLVEMAELDGTEWGEMVLAIVHLLGYRDYVSDELKAALTTDLEDQWEWAKENCEIVEVDETITRKSRTLEMKE